MTPAKMTFVALPSSLGPMTARTTDAVPIATIASIGQRSPRISRRNRPAEPRKFIDFSPGMPMFIMGPPPPGPRRCGGHPLDGCRTLVGAHAASSTLTCEYTISR